MYYDAMLAAVGFAVLFADTSWAGRPGDPRFWYPLRIIRSVPFLLLLFQFLAENAISSWGVKGRVMMDAADSVAKPPGLDWEIGFRNAWDTLAILLLWMWLAVKILAGRIRASIQ